MEKLSILVLSSLYPPYYVGGYELGCRDVVEGLRQRGHDVVVLASTYGVDHACVDGHVYRWLQAELKLRAQTSLGDQWALFKKEQHNRRALQRMINRDRPDLVYVWSIHNTSLSLVRMVQALQLPMTAFVSDHWLVRWAVLDAWSRLPRHPLRRLVRTGLGWLLNKRTAIRLPRTLHLRHAQFASRFLGQLAAPGQPLLARPNIIHWGIDPAIFVLPRLASSNGQRLLYVGQVIEHKGLHTLLEALALLVHQRGYRDVRLTIAGGALFPEYRLQLEQQAATLGLNDYVCWAGQLPRSELPAIYAAHDILVFPSVWDEPFSITILEALAAGLVVVATDTGGTPEIIHPEQTGLLFAKEDAAGCAACLQRVLDDAALRERLAHQGRQLVTTSFTLAGMIDQIEHDLVTIVQSQRSASSEQSSQ